jgi:hypothetical protein
MSKRRSGRGIGPKMQSQRSVHPQPVPDAVPMQTEKPESLGNATGECGLSRTWSAANDHQEREPRRQLSSFRHHNNIIIAARANTTCVVGVSPHSGVDDVQQTGGRSRF